MPRDGQDFSSILITTVWETTLIELVTGERREDVCRNTMRTIGLIHERGYLRWYYLSNDNIGLFYGRISGR